MEKVIILFGENAVRAYEDNERNIKSIEDFLNGLDGNIVERNFNTKEEAEAYKTGVMDAIGWVDCVEINN